MKITRVTVFVFLCANLCAVLTSAQSRRGVVVDERLSALRASPEATSRIKQRLRRGRPVWLSGIRLSRDGYPFLRVAVTRRTSGWILEQSVARRGNLVDARRLIELIEETSDDFTKIRLARICADEYRSTKFAPNALLLLGEAAERSAERLTGTVRRRLGAKGDFFLVNDQALDRFSRIGVRFGLSEGKLVYAGDAWREILRRYPKSNEAIIARER